MRELLKFRADWKEGRSDNRKLMTDSVVAIVGNNIYNGVYFPTEELQKSLSKWDGKPLCLDHSDSILYEIGFINNPRMEEDKLIVKANIAEYTKHAKDAANWMRVRREAGTIPEVSISAWVDTEFEEIDGFDDRVKVARNIDPVHLSLVTSGACSPEDGCGIGCNMRCGRIYRNDNTSVTITYSPADIVLEVDNMSKVNLGVVPSNPRGYGKDAESPWEAPTLGDFTDKAWDELTDAEKRKIASCFAWSPQMPPERFTDLKLPHHDPKTKNVVWRGVAAAMAALLGARGGVDIPEADRRKVYNHLAGHYRDFEKEAPELGGETTMSEEEEKQEKEEKVEEKEDYKKMIVECRKAREELQAKYDELQTKYDELQAKYEELRAEFEKIEEEKKRLEEMRGKPKVENKQVEEKDAEMSEYERLRKLIKSI